jgi:hypothetical protein
LQKQIAKNCKKKCKKICKYLQINLHKTIEKSCRKLQTGDQKMRLKIFGRPNIVGWWVGGLVDVKAVL